MRENGYCNRQLIACIDGVFILDTGDINGTRGLAIIGF